jgi:hypothetical protein
MSPTRLYRCVRRGCHAGVRYLLGDVRFEPFPAEFLGTGCPMIREDRLPLARCCIDLAESSRAQVRQHGHHPSVEVG